jgi:hypothetical protein
LPSLGSRLKLVPLIWLLSVFFADHIYVAQPALAFVKHSSRANSRTSASKEMVRTAHKRKTHSEFHTVTQYAGSQRTVALVRRSRLRHHLIAKEPPKHNKAKARYAYPMDFFLAKPPPFDLSPLAADQSALIRGAFLRGTGDSYSPRTLVKAGVVSYHPIRGGIFWRREPIKYIIIHSTEPGVPQIAQRIIESWSSLGRRHPGAQYVVDRDGTIFQAADPDLATVHVNIFKTLPGINNDDAVGIEMCHSGKQDYPPEQVDAVVKLVVYLQNRYSVPDTNVVTHKYAQQGDHTDPVNFDWSGFLAKKNEIKKTALALHLKELSKDALAWAPNVPAPPENYLQIHRQLGGRPESKTPVVIQPTTPVAAPAVAPLLRGPIEMSPAAATILNRAIEAPLPGTTTPMDDLSKKTGP